MLRDELVNHLEKYSWFKIHSMDLVQDIHVLPIYLPS